LKGGDGPPQRGARDRDVEIGLGEYRVDWLFFGAMPSRRRHGCVDDLSVCEFLGLTGFVHNIVQE
jgi:hypothetical protein